VERFRAKGDRAILRRPWVVAERFFWAVALLCLANWVSSSLLGVAGARRELARFAVLRAAAQLQTGKPDLSLWSAERISAWERALEDAVPAPLAVLRIPRLRLEVAVLEGTDEDTLNRGVGHIEHTAKPGRDGNSGIAGHRDGFFRVLKDIARGDLVELETLSGREIYHVERTWIVQPEDVSVLDVTPTRSLTLVTCYPFYFVGPAPQRFIVRAVPLSDKSSSIVAGR
jgi:sortase A